MYYVNNVTPVSNLQQSSDKFKNQLFKVSVPYLSTLSEFEMRTYGVYQSGVKDIDKELSGQMTNVYISTKDILNYFKQGVCIRLCNNSDIKDIYITIQEYLEAWKLMLQNGINLAEAPSTDLLELDSLATEVFSRAKYYFNSGEAETVLSGYLTQVNRINSHNFFNQSVSKVVNDSPTHVKQNNNGLTTINPIEDSAEIERESLSDYFKRRIHSTKFQRD